MNILTNDPSITGWGWAVIQLPEERVLKVGCIKTIAEEKKKRIRKSDDRIRRISEITHTLHSIIKDYDICFLSAEAPHGSQSAVAAVMIGMVTGVMQTLSDVLDIPIDWYAEGDIKKHLLGKRSAGKQEMIDLVGAKIGTPFTGVKYHDEAVADAIAVYLTAKDQSETLKLMRKLNV